MSKLIVAEPKPGIFACVLLVPFEGKYDASLLARCSIEIRRKTTDIVYQRKVLRERIDITGPKLNGMRGEKPRLQYVFLWEGRDENWGKKDAAE